MERDDTWLDWMVLSRAPALNPRTLHAALELIAPAAGRSAGQAEREGLAGSLLRASDAVRERLGLSAATRDYLNSAAGHATAAERAWLELPHHHVIPFLDPRYPAPLHELKSPPLVLYVAGNAPVLRDPQLAIVGTRNPTPAGRDTAREFAETLAACGLTITSGLATGIDSAAHQGALRAPGVTIAVLGSGVDVIYPRRNRDLSEHIQRRGALVSEFSPGTPPRREHFPRRNRIIAALSLGTLVVEAALRSGSLITARLAGEHNKALFAVPGSIHNPLSRGCHELIRDGAKLTMSAADILSELKFSPIFDSGSAPDPGATPHGRTEAGMDKDRKILLDALGFDPADLDTLVVRSGLKAETVSSLMLILELDGHVQAAPGGRFSRVVRSRR
jgi:DNA processing protein